MDHSSRMDGVEVRTVRDYLGLTSEHLAGMLRDGDGGPVHPDVLRSWEAGRTRVSPETREQLEELEAYTAAAVGELVDELQDAGDPTVVVYLRDADMHAARPEVAHLSARWWRHVAARARREVPGVAIVTAARARRTRPRTARRSPANSETAPATSL